jgi:hypothetical protein
MDGLLRCDEPLVTPGYARKIIQASKHNDLMVGQHHTSPEWDEHDTNRKELVFRTPSGQKLAASWRGCC